MKAKNGKPFSAGSISPTKERTRNVPVVPLVMPEEISIPLKQHIGAPAEPVVAAGDPVKRGQLVGKASGFVSANVHASVAGVVKEVAERADGRGGSCVHVVIEPSKTQEDAFLPPLSAPSAEEIRTRIAEAGIVGMGGAGFPAHVKANPAEPVDVLVLNGAECEPYLTCDDRIMQERTDEIVRGAKYLAVALNATRVIIGIEKNKPEAIARFEESELEVVKLKKQYPMGSEKHLVYCCTGRKIPLGKLPSAAGVSIQNVGTALAVCEAVELGKPLFERVVTLSGGGFTEPKNLLCPVGAPLSALLEAGGITDGAAKFVAGGPMTGTALTGANGVVTKTTSGFLAFTAEETNTEEPTPCINCGKCADVCPMKLMPMQTVFYTAAKDYAGADKYGGVRSCIECGACTYICPARRPIAQMIKTAKAALNGRK